MSKPAIGQPVLYYPDGADHEAVQPQAATVAFVNEDDTVTVGGFDHDGHPFSDHGVFFLSDVNDGVVPGRGAWAKPVEVAQ